MKQPDIDDVKLGAWYAAFAVCPKSKLQTWSCKKCDQTPKVKFLRYLSKPTSGTAGYVAVREDSKDGYFIVSFRGTKNAMNGVTNGSAAQAKFSAIDDNEARVHMGYLNSMETLSKDFIGELKLQLLNEVYKNYKIKVYGHSLGGSMASLASIKIKTELNISWDRLELYTYGQPRVGNMKFAKWFDGKEISTARVVNNNDSVPHAPPVDVLTYTHHGNELFIPAKDSNVDVHYCNKDVYEDVDCSYSISKYSEEAHYHFFDTTTGEEFNC
ncbi:alpha/beta-hydrolase [Neoconidiobolus thromboides FSU 785]|nr:alpha/beta-hydrolase [Neoconidiobolus thromboides FSU 785]